MKFFVPLAFAITIARAVPTERSESEPLGIDVSSHQPVIDWSAVVNSGIHFAYIKATEGTTYFSPTFDSQWTGATNAALIRGAYHFAHPDSPSGAAQAQYFLNNGGGWSADGRTLPGALDLEYNPSGAECYGLTASEMVSWIEDFSNTYQAATSQYPVIYTTTGWWNTCTGNSPAFGSTNPLWIADWSMTLGPLPAGWQYTSFWQYNDTSPNSGDADRWNGDYAGLKSMALGY